MLDKDISKTSIMGDLSKVRVILERVFPVNDLDCIGVLTPEHFLIGEAPIVVPSPF